MCPAVPCAAKGIFQRRFPSLAASATASKSGAEDPEACDGLGVRSSPCSAPKSPAAEDRGLLALPLPLLPARCPFSSALLQVWCGCNGGFGAAREDGASPVHAL